MPAKKMKDGTYLDIVHPLNMSTRQKMQELVMEEFKKVQKYNETPLTKWKCDLPLFIYLDSLSFVDTYPLLNAAILKSYKTVSP